MSFICDKSISGNGNPVYVTDVDRCSFWFEWRTPAACAQSSAPLPDKDDGGNEDGDSSGDNTGGNGDNKDGNNGESGGGTSVFDILFIIMFIFGAAYLLVGVLYNRVFYQSRGMEQIPHYRLWYGIFGFIKDMGMILWYPISEALGKCFSRFGRGSGSGGSHSAYQYSSIRDGQAGIRHQNIDFEDSDSDDNQHNDILRYSSNS